jgi:hypothetical protein
MPMLDLTTMRERAQAVQALADAGQHTLEMKAVLAMFVVPLLSVPVHAGADEWLTIEEYRAHAGVGRKYFEKRLARLGGLTRLQAWEKEGVARRKTIWLIHRSALPQRDAAEADQPAEQDLPTAEPGRTAPAPPPARTEDEAAEDIYAQMMGPKQRK